VKGYIDFKLTRFDWIENIKNASEHGIRFLRGKFYIELFTKDLKVYQKWKKAVRPLGILMDFHKTYKIKKYLGKGVSSKVNPEIKFNPSRCMP